MRETRKTKPNPELPDLCGAVRRVRAAHGLSQTKMAHILGINPQTLSRFELGKQVPASQYVLERLAVEANDAGLTEERDLFTRSVNDAIQRRWTASEQTAVQSPHEWRLMSAAKVAVRFYPERARAIEQAAGEALAVVDEVIQTADVERVSPAFYRELEERINSLAEERSFQSLRKELK